MYGGSEVDELCVQSMDWGDKGAHPGERALNPHEKKKKKEVPALRVRQRAARQIRWDCGDADLLFKPEHTGLHSLQ